MQAEVNPDAPSKPKAGAKLRKPVDWNAIKSALDAGTPLHTVAKSNGIRVKALRQHAIDQGWTSTLAPIPPEPFTPEPPPKHPGGRPETYTVEIGEAICARIAAGEPLNTICSDPNMPSTYAVRSWTEKHPEFDRLYARAREKQADTLADEILRIADTEPDPNRAKVMIDARRWLASKMRPGRYGDKLEVSGTSTVKIEAIRRVIVDSPNAGPDCITADKPPRQIG